MSKFRLAQASAILNLLGAFLVFLSFQATSTKFLLVTGTDNRSFLCVGDQALFAMDPKHGLDLGVGCPAGQDYKPAAVVNTDKPWLGYFGWGMLFLGFFAQLLSIEKPPVSPNKRGH
jgi:hypothetical protein